MAVGARRGGPAAASRDQAATGTDAIIARRGAGGRGIAKTAAARQMLTSVFYGLRDGYIRHAASQAA